MNLKDFDGWNIKKADLDSRTNSIYFHEREIWWTSIGHNVGSEEDGKSDQYSRPVLIFRKFNANFFYGIPLSTTEKRGQYYFPFTNSMGTTSVALLSHMRDYSAKRLLTKYAVMNTGDYKKLQEAMQAIITREAP